jgi:hypothetical protein
LSAVRDCLFSKFAATLHICRPFLHPQFEDAPWRSDRDPLITAYLRTVGNTSHLSRLSVTFLPAVLKYVLSDDGFVLTSRNW